jgi:hypothetical protein
LKRKTPSAIWALRGVTIVVALVVILVIGTIAYSAYEDYNGVRSEFAGGSQQATGKIVVQGPSEIISINITVPNRGLYALNVTVGCEGQTSNVVCQTAQVVVPAGGDGVLHFKMTVVDLSAFKSSSNHRINGTVTITLEPFATLSIGEDFSGFVNTGVS